MRIHLYLNYNELKSYREGKETTARLYPNQPPHDQSDIHVEVYEEEVVEIFPSGFARIRGKGTW